MKIRHVINNLDTGGAERLVVDLTTALRDLGHDASIVTLGASTADSPPWLDAVARDLVTPLQLPLRDPRIRGRLGSAVLGADVVHAHLFPTLYWSAVTRHRAVHVYTEHSTKNRRRGRTALRAPERFAYRRHDRVVAISKGVGEVTRQYLADLGVRTPVQVIDNGIDLSRFRPASTAHETDARSADGRPLRLLVVGSLDERKDPLRAIRLVRGLSGVQLTLVGDGPLRAEVDQDLRDHAEEDRVRVLGIRSDIADLMAQSDALLVTSRHEGFGLAAAEAMACGLPVLAPRLDGLTDTVGLAGLLHTPGSDDEARRDITRLRDDPELRRRLAGAARAASAVFDIQTTAKAHETMYQSALGGTKP
ncbi:glycosyltransferase [Pedococcus bigeumensis]|uniref:glycosyltransferase n=1 Tax=Pedococcus bigeumensis TaxID=433644 RepID=UPI0013872E92|nr:glycosyltransferase [Pedococcus bigeumensis]